MDNRREWEGGGTWMDLECYHENYLYGFRILDKGDVDDLHCLWMNDCNVVMKWPLVVSDVAKTCKLKPFDYSAGGEKCFVSAAVLLDNQQMTLCVY